MKTGSDRFPSGLVSHLSDGGAELALKHLLQGLELVSRDVARLLQLLQQLDGSGNIWREGGGEGAEVREANSRANKKHCGTSLVVRPPEREPAGISEAKLSRCSAPTGLIRF